VGHARIGDVFFSLSSWQLALIIFAVVGGSAGLGFAIGVYLREHSDTYREPFGVLQGALLGLVGRLASLNNRVPDPVLAVEVIAAAVALGLLALHIFILGRGLAPVLLAAALVSVVLLVTFDLDRPTRGLIKVPATPLIAERASMSLPLAASGP
jgi:peptidoglycan/LPS O-acetylase OafA/YrhL